MITTFRSSFPVLINHTFSRNLQASPKVCELFVSLFFKITNYNFSNLLFSLAEAVHRNNHFKLKSNPAGRNKSPNMVQIF